MEEPPITKRQKYKDLGQASHQNTHNPPQLDGPVLFSLSGYFLYGYMVALPIVALVACVVVSLIFNFKGSVSTQCHVPNYLPSISAAIGGYTPQKYIWRICIALHIAPRLLVCVMYFNYYRSYPSIRGLYRLGALLAATCHFVENMSLVTLSYVSSTENYDIHEGSFYVFLVFSQMYMLLTLVLFRRAHSGRWTCRAAKSYKYKRNLWLLNVASLVAAAYFFFRHNTYCEPGMYTVFAVCEYSVVLSNIAFHASFSIDFGKGSLSFVNDPDNEKID